MNEAEGPTRNATRAEGVLCLDLDGSGQDRVDADPVRAQFPGKGAGQAKQPGLRGAVRDEVRPAGTGVDAADVHDPAPAALDHAGRERVAGAVVGGQVHSEGVVPGDLVRVLPGDAGGRSRRC